MGNYNNKYLDIEPIEVALDYNRFVFDKVNAFFLFGLLINGLGLPIDKFFLFVYLLYLLFITLLGVKIHAITLTVLCFWLLLAFSTSLFNFTFKPMIFYPVVGMFFIFTIVKIDWLRTLPD